MMCGGWIVVLVAIIYMQIRILTARIKKATVNNAVLMVNRQEGIFLDIRPADVYSKGHIANSVNITAADVKGGKTQRIERSKDKPVIVVGKDKFDSECFHTARALKKQGYSKVFVLEGGILDWEGANLPLTTRR